jgi:hypothetical protein
MALYHGQTSYEVAARGHFEAQMEAYPETYPLILQTYRTHADQDIYRVFHDGPYSRDPVVWFYFHQFLTAVLTGELLIKTIRLGVTPLRDALTKENEALLNSHLPEPFRARVVGGTQDADGELYWDGPISAMRSLDGSFEHTEHISIRHPGLLSLEIGNNMGWKTYFQVSGMSTGVARWPYDCEWLWLIFTTPKRRKDTAPDL